MKRPEIAVNKFKEGYNCAQSMLYSYADALGITGDMALRIATGFGAGMGRKQEVCGAISGGIMVLNMMYGRGENEDRQKQEKTYAKVREFIDLFEKELGTINCKKLLGGCDLMTPQGQNNFKENKMIEKCYACVERANTILEKVISRQ